MSIDASKVIIIRERVFFNHLTPECRTITEEFILLNISDSPIPSIFLTRPQFMVGLKIYDESNKEIPFYTNKLTRVFFSDYHEYEMILRDMNIQQSYVIWIKLKKEDFIQPYEPKIIKLVYNNLNPPESNSFSANFKKEKLFFNVPHYYVNYVKKRGINHDTFYIISIPDNCDIRYKILRNGEIVNGELMPLERAYEDNNGNIVSIRMPASENASLFSMEYYLIPKRNERLFYYSLIFSLLGLSIVIFLFNLKIVDLAIGDFSIDSSEYNPLKQISVYRDAITGGIITASSAIIGFIGGPFTNRARFWFLAHIFISGLSYLFIRLNN